MRIVFFTILALATIVLHLSLFPFAELPIAVLVALLFFVGRQTALALAIVFGFVFDLFSPIFGLHLILYPLIVFIAWKVYAALLTDQSLLSFGVLSLGSFLLFRLFGGVAFFILSNDPGPLPFLHTFRLHGEALGIHIMTSVLFYFVGSALTKPSLSRYRQ